MTLQRIREVKWPWVDENQGGFISPFRVSGVRENARFLTLLYINEDWKLGQPIIGGELRMYFEEHSINAVGKDRYFTIHHAHNVHFTEDYVGSAYLASAPIHGNRLVAHVYEITGELGAVRNRIQAGQSAERLARAARGRRA